MHDSTDLMAFNNSEPNDNLNTLGSEVEALRDNTFGILADDGSIDDKIMRLLNLLPMAFQVMDEARETIARLRDEVDKANKNG